MRVRPFLAVSLLAVLVTAGAASSAPPTKVAPKTVEPLASYVPQSTCSPSAKPGTVALSKLVLSAYPGTGTSGIVRACIVGGRSEHKEGRAWDWRVSYASTKQRAQAADFVSWLLKADVHGNAAANARRLGVMYIIWNKRIWGAYNSAGWRAYKGADPHITHMHISLSWAGANKKTSYWTGTVAGAAAGSSPVVARPVDPVPVVAAPVDAVHDTEHEREARADDDERRRRRR